MTGRGELPWEGIPDEYQDGDIDDTDAMAHAFSIEYLEQPLEYMNEEELFLMESELDPLEQMLADEEAEWKDDNG